MVAQCAHNLWAQLAFCGNCIEKYHQMIILPAICFEITSNRFVSENYLNAQEEDIPYRRFFKFNNSALYEDPHSKSDKVRVGLNILPVWLCPAW